MSDGDLGDLEKTLEQMEKDLQDNAGAAIYKLGLQIEGDAREHHVPVDTGFLRGSLYVSHPKKRSKGVYVLFGSGARYAAAVHELHTPFLLNAIKANQSEAGKIFKEFMDKAIAEGQVIKPEDTETPSTPGQGRTRGRQEAKGD